MARRGRPTKAPPPGEKASLGLKVTAALKARLEAAAEQSGRTQSQEAEARLERSFDRLDLMPEVLELAYGRQAAGLMMAIGEAMTMTGRIAGTISKPTQVARDDWLADPFAYQEAMNAAATVMEDLRPEGGIVPPPRAKLEIWGASPTQTFGYSMAKRIMLAVKGKIPAPPKLALWVANVRSLLGCSQEQFK